jgi:hypothetical protein
MRVISFCKISGHSIVLDGERQPDLESHLQGQMLSEKFDNLFKVMHGDYPRFYRLDDYSKLGIIAAELILRKAGLDTVTPKPDMGIILHTRSGTLYADSMYAQTIQDILDFNPDPELFARIHSNAVCSDIALRNNITGESAVFLSDGFNYEMFYRMGADVFATDPDVKQLLMGYLECYGSYASAFFCLVEKAMDDRPEDYELRQERFFIELLRIY